MFLYIKTLMNGERMSNFTNPIIPNGVISNSLVSKDGKIGITKQGENGDCWLLSAINALNSTDKGKELISNMLEYHNNGNNQSGYTVVHLSMGDFKITDREVANARQSKKYASGDDDMIIFQLAAEKAIKSSGDNYAYDSDNTPEYVEDLVPNSDKSTIERGDLGKAAYIFGGNSATICKSDVIIKDGNAVWGKNGINEALQLYMSNPSNNIVMNASIKQGTNASLKDVQTGENINFIGNHQYSIESIDNNVVTLTNPKDSGKKLKISINDFKNTFTQIEYIDLDAQDNKRNYVSQEYTTDGKNKNFKFNYQDGTSAIKTYTNGKLNSMSKFDSNNKLVSTLFYQNGKPVNEIEYNADNTKKIHIFDKSGKNKVRCINVNANGEVTGVSKYNTTASKWEKTKINFNDFMALGRLKKINTNDKFHIKNNGSYEHVLSKLNQNGEIDSNSSVMLSNSEYERLNRSLLLQKENLTPSEIKSLLNINI